MNQEIFDCILNDYKNDINFYELNSSKYIKEIFGIIKHIYLQIYDNYEKLDNDVKFYTLNYRNSLCFNLENNISQNSKQIEILKKVKQPEQRTPEWYIFRKNRLTASDLGTVMGINPYSKRNILIAKKCGFEEPFYKSSAIKHGVKFEDVAVSIYEKRNNVKIYEYGCIPHPTIKHFGASPDGICDPLSKNKEYIGRMLEIKCPKSRVINEYIPDYYELQVQGQLEVCNLEYCDYLECAISEYDNEQEFIDDCGEGLDVTKKNNEKGVLIETYNSSLGKDNYFYLNKFKTLEEINTWKQMIMENLKELKLEKITYWRLNEYNIKLVKRDRKRFNNDFLPEINRFWNDVLKHREIGYESLLNKRPKKELVFLPDTP